MANLLQAIQCIVKNSISTLEDSKQGKNRIQQQGISLEELIKDIFSGSLDENDKTIRVNKHSESFSYLGNSNNPPDLMIKYGDAIEVKKITSFKSGIQLNSSYPKSKLVVDDPMITADCRNAKGEEWESKDLIYAIGVVKDNKLKRLWFIVGDCLAADSEIYNSIRDKIIAGVDRIRNIEFSQNKELDRYNNFCLSEIAYSRIGGAWRVSNPEAIYDYLNINYDEDANLQVITIMTVKKYHSFSQSDIDKIETMSVEETTNMEIRDVQINSPSNCANLIDAKLIIYQN